MDTQPADGWTVARVAQNYGHPVSTVETMRARDTSFPPPIGRVGRAFVYAPKEIQEWAGAHGWAPVGSHSGPTASGGLGSLPDVPTAALAALGHLTALGRLTADAGPEALLHELVDPSAPGAEQVNLSGIAPLLQESLASASEDDREALVRLVHDSDSWATRVDSTIEEHTRDEGGRQLPSYSSPLLAAWIVAASGPLRGVVADPACGTGLLLSRASEGSACQRRIGIDQDADALRVAALRLLAHGQEAELLLGDALSPTGPLRAFDAECDLVVGDVPSGLNESWPNLRTRFGRPPKNEQEFLWLAVAYEMLRPGGRAVICTPARALETPGRGATLRAALMQEGAIRAVIALPKGMRPGLAPALALWVLSKPELSSPAAPILTINAALLDQQLGTTAAQQLVRDVLERSLQRQDGTDDLTRASALSLALPDMVPADAFRAIIPLLDSNRANGFNLAPWSPAATAIGAVTPPHKPPASSPASVAPHLSGAPVDTWRALVNARDQLNAVMDALHDRHVNGAPDGGTLTLAELVRSGHLLLFDVRHEDGPSTITPSRPSPVTDDVTPGQKRGPTRATTRPRAGDVAIGRLEGATGHTYVATIITRADARSPLPDSTRRIIRSLPNLNSVSPETVAAAINGVAATGWPQGSRGDLNVDRALSYIRVPVEHPDREAWEHALTLRTNLLPLLDRLADPLTWG